MMNERLKELAVQAGLKVESWMTNPPKPFQILGSTEQFEKLAELIVRECAKIVDQYISDCGEIGVLPDYVLNEPFGIK